MKKKKLQNQNASNKISLKAILLLVALFSLNSLTFGQMALRYSDHGQYDVTMISSMVLQPCWVTTGSTTSNVNVVRPVTTADQLACGDLLSLNNKIVQAGIGGGGDGPLLVGPAASISGTSSYVAFGYADCDDDMSTFQSSAAYLDFGADMSCTTVKAAYLYWAGCNGADGPDNGKNITYSTYPGLPTMNSHGGGTTGDVTATYNQILFKAPGDAAYTTVTGALVPGSGRTGSSYVCVADVTGQVVGKPGGLYWAANIQSGINDVNSSSGWSLIVIFEPPNCPPRTIKIWDGMVDEGDNVTFNFAAGEVPATGNSISYLGFGGLDTEDYAYLLSPDPGSASAMASNITFKSNTGPTVTIQPFTDGDQPAFPVTDRDGDIIDPAGRDGLVSSQLTRYDKFTGLNGNQLTRLPSTKYTGGYDAHHMKLPAGSMGAGATSAVMTLPDEQMGGSSAFMSYMAIETLQPNLVFSLTSSVATTPLGGIITYELVVKNIGGLISEPGAYINDTLDLPVDYIDPSVNFYNKLGGSITPPTPTAYNYDGTKDVNERLRFYLPQIAAGDGLGGATDSVTITFQALVLSDPAIWLNVCSRTINNRATVYYKNADNDDFQSGSNELGGCGGGGVDAGVLVDDIAITNAYNAKYNKTFDISGTPTANVQSTMLTKLALQGMSAAKAATYTLTDIGGNPFSAALNFDPTYTSQIFLASLELEYDCIETYEFTFTSAFEPAIFTLGPAIDNSCSSLPDGAFDIVVEKCDNGVFCQVFDEADLATPVFVGVIPAGEVTGVANKTFNVTNLSGAKYYVQLVSSIGEIQDLDSIVVAEPSPLTLILTADNISVCAGDPVNLTAAVVGGLPSHDFVWKTSADSVTWSVVAGPTADLDTHADTPAATTYYKAYACDGACSTTGGVKVTVNTIPTITGTTPASRCGTGTVTLGATASAGTINWYAAATGGASLGTGTSFTTPSIAVTTTYYVDATNNSCTTATRTAVIATITGAPTITGTTPASRCGTGTVTLGATASSGTINWYAAATGGASLGTGTSFVTPSIAATTTYYVDADNGCVTPTRTAVIATVNAIPTITGTAPASRCGTGTVTLGATSSAGTINWYAAATGGASLGTGISFTTPSIAATTTYYVDADDGCVTATRTAVIATVNALPTITGTTPSARCGTGTVTLGATSSAGTINWYAAATGGASLGTGTSFTTPSIAATTTYYVDADDGCVTATRTAVIATVNALPTITGTTPSARCGTGTVTLGATASAGTINWYAAATGGASLGTGTSFTTPSIAATTTYYVDADDGCVTATRTAVIATVNTIPTITGTTPASRCGTGTVVLGATSSAGTINWYAAATGGASLGTGTSFTTPSIAATTTYYVDADDGCVTATRTAVIATVNTIPTITGTTPASRCGTGTVVLGATSSAGTINWYAAATGGASLGTGTSFTTPSIAATTTYYVDADDGCVTATRTAVIATVNTIPTITGTTPASRCGTGTVVLGATSSAGTINWYAAATGGVSLGTGTSFTTPSIAATTTYYVDADDGCVTATRTAVIATVNILPTITAGTFDVCEVLTIPLTGSGMPDATTPWTSATPSVATIDGSGVVTGVLAGTSLITYMDNNGCVDTATVTVNACTSLTLDQSTLGSSCQNGTISYTITLTNPSAVTSTGIEVMDLIPASNLTFVSATPSQGTYNGITGLWDVGDLASTSSADLTITATATTVGATIINESYVSLENGNTYANYAAADIAMSDSTEVDVYALPTISGTLTVCDGLTTTLSGTNTAHATTPWISATTATATIDNVGEVTAVAAGTSLITYMDDNTCTATATVTVNANPTLSGTLSACETGTTSLSGTNTANLTTPWVSATTAVATIDNAGLVTSVTDGSSLITYMDTNGCIDTATVVINPDPTISGTLTVCDGLTTTLSGTNTAHATTPWVSASTANATIDNVGEVTAVGAGTSLITYMDDNSCTATGTVTINANPTLGGTLVACETGTTLLTGTGTPNVTTPWVSATTAAATIDNAGLVTSVSSGTSLITYMDINGCIDTATVTINDMPTITLTSANNTQTFCSTAAGEATIVDITYNLGGSATDVVAVNLPAGVTGTTVGTVYTLSGTATTPGVYNYALATSGQVSPCDSARVSGTITVHPPITATYTNTDVTVPAGSDGTITIVTENGGSGAAIEYELRDSVGTVTVQPYDAPLTGLSSGTYKLFAKNPLESCEYIIDSITIDEPGAIQGDTIVTNVTCKDGMNGSIVAEVTIGGTTPYEYQLERKDGTIMVPYGAALALGTPETFSSLAADTFQVRVRDFAGAVVLIKNNIIVHEPDSVQTIIGVVTNATCNAYTDGSIVVSATGGDGSYMYSNDGGSTYQVGTTFSSLGAATYSLMARDANMCVSSVKTQDITDPLVLVLDSVVTNPVCAGVEASAVINATGGSGIYEYSINAGTTWSSSSTISNMTSDLTVDVRDDKGCTSNIFVDVTLVDTIKATLSSTDVTTPGGTDGTISISGITGGNGNAIEYAVYDSIGTTLIQAYDATLVGLPEALYTIRARNVGETCDVKIDTIRVSEPGAIIGVATKVDVDCNGNTTGSITVQVTTGGTPNYELQLESADGLTIISAFGSTAAVAASTPVTFTGLASGSYKIKVRDAVSYECFIAGTIAISQPAALDISASVFTDPDCYNQLGSFEFDIQGGSSPYQYEMNTSGTWLAVTDGVILNSLADGAYSIIVRDDSACTATVTGNILIPDTIKAPIAFTDPLCNGASGSITFGTITGGTGPYAYELDGSGTWKSVSSGASVAGIVASLSPGSSHSILIRDSKACTSLPILGTTTMPSKVQYVKTDIIPLCSTDLGAVVLSTLNGGDNSYEYQLNGGAWISIVQGDTVKNIPNGNYTINIRDGQLCLATPITGIVNVPSPVTTNVFVNSPLCNSGTGWVTISNLTGGTPGYEYLLNNTGLWQSLTDNQVIPNLADGAFTIDIRDANRCPAAQISDAIVIPDSAELALTNGPQNQSVCVGLSITPVVYTYGGGATDATVTGDLHGLIVTKDATAKTVTISGTPTANTNYTVTTVGPDMSCASQIENGGVVINSLPTPTIDGNDNLCAETVGAVYKTQAGMNNYQWTVSSGGLITSGNGSDSIFVTWNTAGQQTVSVNYVDGNTCTALNPKVNIVTVQPIPNSPLVEDYATCKTTGTVAWTSTIQEASGGQLYWYKNQFGGNSFIPQKVNKSVISSETLYASVRSSIGCESSRVPVTIAVNSIPIVSVDQEDISNIQIEATNGASPYDYTVGEQSGTFLGSYNVGMLSFGINELEVTDVNGCKSKINFYIDPVPLVPDDFFSPNEDGNNSVWSIENIQFYPKTEIFIYDRYGKELKKYKGINFNGWDGTYNGSKVPTTDYWYVIQVRETGKRLVGHFLLKR